MQKHGMGGRKKKDNFFVMTVKVDQRKKKGERHKIFKVITNHLCEK